ncbi:hypothetical protein DOTSEDRAFT_37184 [Dothistroma septosporum NZE10]|uniref:Uncharacterized protein n=1 Tax=Dothistroma septosporum (strain NZE10 / CBS 128990) TaxID=675120 RepID=N1PIC0_DOTSN|nr:hypothetical protein DOTSEDRAFT_37184 [Dothistroma septosporum NZE10]
MLKRGHITTRSFTGCSLRDFETPVLLITTHPSNSAYSNAAASATVAGESHLLLLNDLFNFNDTDVIKTRDYLRSPDAKAQKQSLLFGHIWGLKDASSDTDELAIITVSVTVFAMWLRLSAGPRSSEISAGEDEQA